MLAKHYHTEWVPEYARTYIEKISREYNEGDLLQIAKGQIALENEKLSLARNNMLFCDTDLYVIKVWSEHRYNSCHPWILQQIARRKYDLYLLTDIDIPWQSDPQREHPEPAMREYFYRVYLDLVIHSGAAWKNISGDYSTRVNHAIAEVDKLMR